MFFALLVWAQLASAQTPTSGAVVLQLKTYGWEPPIPHEINGPSIVIDHQNRVLIGFTVRERNGLVTRNQPSLTFHIVRFLPDGKPDLLLSLPTDATGSTAIYLSDTDQIVARANDSIHLLQADDRNPHDTTWKNLAPCPQSCLVTQSHSRHTLHLYTSDGDPPVTLIRLSQQPVLQRCGKAHRFIRSAEESIQNFPQSITDEFAYFPLDGDPYRWPHCDYEHRVELPLHINGRWNVLNEDLFISGVSVISFDGQVRFKPNVGEHESVDNLWAPIRASDQGNRLAMQVRTVSGGNRILDIGSRVTARRVAVYDVEAAKEIASIPARVKLHYSFAFDLSPDGRKLAVLEDDVLRIVDLDRVATSDVH